jgi:hypothetical protein
MAGEWEAVKKGGMQMKTVLLIVMLTIAVGLAGCPYNHGHDYNRDRQYRNDDRNRDSEHHDRDNRGHEQDHEHHQ